MVKGYSRSRLRINKTASKRRQSFRNNRKKSNKKNRRKIKSVKRQDKYYLDGGARKPKLGHLPSFSKAGKMLGPNQGGNFNTIKARYLLREKHLEFNSISEMVSMFCNNHIPDKDDYIEHCKRQPMFLGDGDGQDQIWDYDSNRKAKINFTFKNGTKKVTFTIGDMTTPDFNSGAGSIVNDKNDKLEVEVGMFIKITVDNRMDNQLFNNKKFIVKNGDTESSNSKFYIELETKYNGTSGADVIGTATQTSYYYPLNNDNGETLGEIVFGKNAKKGAFYFNKLVYEYKIYGFDDIRFGSAINRANEIRKIVQSGYGTHEMNEIMDRSFSRYRKSHKGVHGINNYRFKDVTTEDDDAKMILANYTTVNTGLTFRAFNNLLQKCKQPVEAPSSTLNSIGGAFSIARAEIIKNINGIAVTSNVIYNTNVEDIIGKFTGNDEGLVFNMDSIQSRMSDMDESGIADIDTNANVAGSFASVPAVPTTPLDGSGGEFEWFTHQFSGAAPAQTLPDSGNGNRAGSSSGVEENGNTVMLANAATTTTAPAATTTTATTTATSAGTSAGTVNPLPPFIPKGFTENVCFDGVIELITKSGLLIDTKNSGKLYWDKTQLFKGGAPYINTAVKKWAIFVKEGDKPLTIRGETGFITPDGLLINEKHIDKATLMSLSAIVLYLTGTIDIVEFNKKMGSIISVVKAAYKTQFGTDDSIPTWNDIEHFLTRDETVFKPPVIVFAQDAQLL